MRGLWVLLHDLLVLARNLQHWWGNVKYKRMLAREVKKMRERGEI
jgi:hypothetical protein